MNQGTINNEHFSNEYFLLLLNFRHDTALHVRDRRNGYSVTVLMSLSRSRVHFGDVTMIILAQKVA